MDKMKYVLMFLSWTADVLKLSQKICRCHPWHLGSHGEWSRTMTKYLSHSPHPSTPLRMTILITLLVLVVAVCSCGDNQDNIERERPAVAVKAVVVKPSDEEV